MTRRCSSARVGVLQRGDNTFLLEPSADKKVLDLWRERKGQTRHPRGPPFMGSLVANSNVTSFCKSGKQHKTFSSALCTMDDASYFLVIRLGPKTSQCEKNVTVVSTVTGCDVTNCATTVHGFNKQASSRREAVSDSRGPSLH